MCYRDVEILYRLRKVEEGDFIVIGEFLIIGLVGTVVSTKFARHLLKILERITIEMGNKTTYC